MGIKTLFLTAFSLSIAFSARAESDPTVVPGVALSEAVQKRVLGLDYEASDSELVKALRDNTQAFIRFRRGRMDTKEKLLWMTECLSRPEDNVYCEFLVEERADRARLKDLIASTAEPEEEGPTLRDDLFKLSEHLTGSKLAPFKTVTEGALHRALRLFPNWEPLQPIAAAALEADPCEAPALLTTLGQKAEEFLPHPGFRGLAASLYERAARCSQSDVAPKARFRASLMYIWEGEYRKAEPHLEALSADKGGDYVSRSLYWRAHIAQETGNKLLANAIQSKLLKDFPLSYHGLILSRGSLAQTSRVLQSEEPSIQFRSRARPELNRYIHASEMLFQLKAADLAGEILTQVIDRIEQTEPEVRIYASLLLNRAGETVPQFRVLSSVFRDDPTLISRHTLQLFYPLQRFELLKQHSGSVDPFLIAALIRQESGFRTHARSPAGAVGLMQLMPETARRVERISRRALLNPNVNVRVGVKYYRQLLSRYSSDAEMALAAYNAGPHNVDEWRRRYTVDNRVLFFDLVPFKETRDYVALISRNYYWYLSLYKEIPRVISDVKGTARGGRRLASTRRPLLFTLFGPM